MDFFGEKIQKFEDKRWKVPFPKIQEKLLFPEIYEFFFSFRARKGPS